jgi:hypothetical protein
VVAPSSVARIGECPVLQHTVMDGEGVCESQDRIPRMAYGGSPNASGPWPASAEKPSEVLVALAHPPEWSTERQLTRVS